MLTPSPNTGRAPTHFRNVAFGHEDLFGQARTERPLPVRSTDLRGNVRQRVRRAVADVRDAAY